MIRLQDQPSAQYLYAGDTRSAGAGVQVAGVELGSFRVYLGILTPQALARIGMPRTEERLGKSASIYLHTLFDGVRGGRGVAQEGTAPDTLARMLAEGTQAQNAVETDSRFRQALQSVRQFREPQCLAFQLTVTAAGAIGIGISPLLRIEQSNRGYGQISFLPQSPARISLAGGFGTKDFKIQVG
jgi:hypothetical protein